MRAPCLIVCRSTFHTPPARRCPLRTSIRCGTWFQTWASRVTCRCTGIRLLGPAVGTASLCCSSSSTKSIACCNSAAGAVSKRLGPAAAAVVSPLVTGFWKDALQSTAAAACQLSTLCSLSSRGVSSRHTPYTGTLQHLLEKQPHLSWCCNLLIVQIRTLCLSPDGQLLLSIDENGRALLIARTRRVLLHHFSFKGPVSAAAFSPDGRYVAVAVGRLLQVRRPVREPRACGGGRGVVVSRQDKIVWGVWTCVRSSMALCHSCVLLTQAHASNKALSTASPPHPTPPHTIRLDSHRRYTPLHTPFLERRCGTRPAWPSS